MNQMLDGESLRGDQPLGRQVLVRLAWLSCLMWWVNSAAGSPANSTPAMWGALEPGSHQVGFETIFAYDYSRPAVPYADWDGRLYSAPPQPGRQMQINVWYPATNTSQTPLRYSHYLELMAQQVDFAPVNQDRLEFAESQFIVKTNALGGNGSFDDKKLAVLKELRTAAHLDATPARGRYPVVVYPNGTSPAAQSILSEYLASHGFVVVAAALKGQHSFTEDISAKGIETAADDLAFIVNVALQLDYAEPEKLCLMGNAVTSSHIVAYQSRNANVDCLISLDGGLLSRFEQGLLRQTLFYEASAVTAPILALFSSSDSVSPENIQHLVYTQQYLFEFPQMSEFHFLNFGFLEAFVPQIIGEPRGDVVRGSEIAAVYVRNFLQAHLSDSDTAHEFLMKPVVPDNAAQGVRSDVTKPRRAPPSTTEVKDRYLKEGISYIQRTYAELKEESEQPFPESFYVEIRNWLAWKKDPDFSNRYLLYALALDSFPDAALINFEQAYHAMKTGRLEEAKQLNLKTRELIESGSSDQLTPDQKQQIKRIIERDLQSLP